MFELCVVALVSSLGLGGVPIQASQTSLQVLISQSDGTPRGRTTAREERPEDLLTTPRVNMSFLQRRDARDQKGRIVSGIGISTWLEGDAARVWLFSIVPKDDVPNAFYATPQGIVNTKRESLGEFVLKVGEKRRLTEMEEWGVDPFVLELMRVTR